ncbi:MAG TPA: glycosyltransferase family 4 protein [Oligoflexus sp.]|uniref:glycosyltransferase family 4 protein n=1 Tax=Oligoflexus sp. TaxID=1971216 RepID=UPI002D6D4E29|nr:glycosyltransferase family 4 protein [Oligoflexus sp.]HYX35679.1 glycosyltransferase family 4 protein [Oligoflexus sp.]
MPFKVLHIDSESTWRGGENQIRLLLQSVQNETWQWHLAAPPGSEAIARLSHLAQTLAVPMRGARILTAAFAVARYVRQHGIQLIDCQSGRAHNLGLFVKKLCPDVKLVVHRRVDYPPAPGSWHRRKYLHPSIDRYICISSAIQRILAEFGVPGTRLALVRSAVDAGPFQGIDRREARRFLAAEWQIPPEKTIIGNLAYITEQKDHATLIRALAVVRDRGLPFFAYIAGDGALRSAAEALALELGLGQDRLRFLGVRQDVAQLLAATDIFALSSQDEGLGTSLLDAVHSGCTLVATAVGGIPEIILHNQTGLLAPAKDFQKFADNLERLLRDPPLLETLRQGATAHVAREFSLQSMVQGNLRVYQELLSGPSFPHK